MADDSSLDVIITDSSDTKGAAECLFKEDYYRLMRSKLKKEGIMCSQGESIWFDLESIAELVKTDRSILAKVAYASTMTCTYPRGQIGFLICSNSAETDLTWPIDKLDEEKVDLKYYRWKMHSQGFVLARFVQKKLDEDLWAGATDCGR